MKEIVKVALGVFLGGGALLITQAIVLDVQNDLRAREFMRRITPMSAAQPLETVPPANSCAGSKDPACGVTPSGKSVSCIIGGEAWRMADNLCQLRGGKIE